MEPKKKTGGRKSNESENMWYDARKRLKERHTEEHEQILQDQLTRLYDLLNRCRESGNRRVESEVLRDLTKLYGLEQAKKIDITSGDLPISVNIILNSD